MKEIRLTQGKVALVDDEDFERLNQHNWQAVKSGLTFYASRSVWFLDGKRRMLFMHRAVMNTPDNMHTDHINSEVADYGLDNRKQNLRVCTRVQNGQNRNKNRNATSNYKGLSWETDRQLWGVHIKVGAKRIRLGRFVSEIDAAKEYNAAAMIHFGEFAKLNVLNL